MSGEHARSRQQSQRTADSILPMGDKMGGLFQQVWFWVPAVRSHCWCPLQQWGTYEPSARQKVRLKANNSLRQFKHEICFSSLTFLFSFFFFFSRTVHYYAELGQCSVFSAAEAPEQFISQVTVLKYFSHYMEENLMDVSSAPSGP